MKIKTTASVVAAALVLSVGGAAGANAAQSGSDSASVRVGRTATAVESRRHAATMWQQDGLDAGVVNKYNRFVKAERTGTYRIEVPKDVTKTDPKGAEAAQKAVGRANRAIEQQLKLAGVDKGAYKYGDPIAMGPHATFTPLWWGMQFTLDPTAAKQLISSLDSATATVGQIMDMLAKLGIVIGPEVAGIIKIVMGVITGIVGLIKKCSNENGMIINSLWLPVPWCEAPKAPFKAGRQL